MGITEAWIKEKSKVPTQIIQVGGCTLRDAQKMVMVICCNATKTRPCRQKIVYNILRFSGHFCRFFV